ncbi:MAG: HD domain-containing protein [Proteobacteria bacterium]|nr:HD domain-containing protein [Pseudomonadota bacterium]
MSAKRRLAELERHRALAAVVEAAAGPVYLVGGSVRDLLMDRDLHDLDLALSGPLEGVAARAARTLGARAVPMGRPPLTMFRLVHHGLILDLCPLEGPDIETDLCRRDLTVNAMGLELEAGGRIGRLVDPCGGRRDLETRKARFVSEANVLADPLRMLRLFRFSAVLGLEPDPDSLALVARHAARIQTSAGERVREELLQLLAAPRAAETVGRMLDQGLLEALVPELTVLRGLGQNEFHHLDVLAHTMLAFSELEAALDGAFLPGWAGAIQDWLSRPGRPARLKLALLLHDLGKPAAFGHTEDGRVHFYNHDRIGRDMALEIGDRMRLSVEERDEIGFLIRHHLHIFHLHEARRQGGLTRRGVFRFARLAGDRLWGLVLHAWADAAATLGPAQQEQGGPAALREFLDDLLGEIELQRRAADRAPNLVTGRDLMQALDLEPSPLIGRLLEAVAEARALGRIATREEALALARDVLERGEMEAD